MLRGHIKNLIQSAVQSLVNAQELPQEVLEVAIEVTDTKTPEHGDYACPFALSATKRAGKPPRAIGEALRAELLKLGEDSPFSEIDIAGPGFLNLRLKPSAISGTVAKILEAGDRLSHWADDGQGRRIHIEYVSVNPNGPITVGSGRGAAFGDTLSRVFAAAGDHVEREYYINDGVNSEQMRLFAESVKAHALGLPVPDNGYKGEYVIDVARQVQKLHPDAASHDDAGWWQSVSQELMIERQRSDLATFRVHYDRWFSEQQDLHESGMVEKALEGLVKSGAADTECYSNEVVREKDKADRIERKPEECGPLWLRSTRWGDDKDRVLTRSDGRPAYIAADAAYLQSKLGDRNYDKAYLILGPDHHGYIPRMYAACQALGFPLSRFEIVIFQIVRFLKDGKPAPMRKRDGNIYELRDLVDELGANAAPNAPKEEQQRIGVDVSRFFYLMRSQDTHMDFDIDLATKQSDENPVFYAQYAYARICSVLSRAEAEIGISTSGFSHELLVHPRELSLIKKILDLPHEVSRCAADYGVHRLTTYAVELARTYHHFYDACRVIQKEEPDLSRSRVALCIAARHALKSAFDLLGVSAPERMDRAE